MNNYPFGTGKHNFGYIPDPDTDVCADASHDETLCETCVYYSVDKFGVPSCCGNEYKEREE